MRMWPNSLLLMWSIIAASVVDLPEPVGPVTRIRPCGWSISSAKMRGQPRSSSVRIWLGMVRNTAPAPRFWLKALTRKRARPGISKREVDLEELLVVAALLVRHDVVDQRVHLLVVERRDVDAADVAVDPDHRRQAGRQMQVGGLVLDRKRQQFSDIHAALLVVRGFGLVRRTASSGQYSAPAPGQQRQP